MVKDTVKALFALCLLLTAMCGVVAAQAPKDFVSVDAASYQFAVAPNTIAAGFTSQVTAQTAFGADTDDVTAGIQLPTLLGGVRVTVNNRPAGLLAVTPNQINYLVPTDTEVDGPATVVVTDDQGNILAQGTLNMVTSLLSIFTATQDGNGTPAALFTGDGVNYFLVNNADGSANVVPAGQYLILFCTGLDGVDSGNVKAFLGGVEATVTYAGTQGFFVGLGQINLQIPDSLANQGPLELVITNGSTTSNKVIIDLGGNPAAPAGAPVIIGLGTPTALAGEVVTITGTNFPTTLAEATVRLGSRSGQVVSTSATEMTFIVPFGAATNKVTVGNAAGERQSSATLNITTSISGLITSDAGDPLSGMPVYILNTNIYTTTDSNGQFLLPNVSAGTARLEIDASGTGYVSESISLVVANGRDNEFSAPIALLQESGNTLLLQSAASTSTGHHLSTANASQPIVIEHNGIRLEIPGTVTFRDGGNTGRIGVTRLSAASRLPMTLPTGIYPSVMVLITPRGTTFGAKDGTDAATLIFPNPDQFPAGTSLDLYAYRSDVTPSAFVKKGTATVNSAGDKIVATGLIDVATIWFVGVPGDNAPITRVTGQVTDNNDKPVSGARVFVRGRGGETDREGKFSINGVRAKNNDDLNVEVLYLTPAGVALKASKTVKAVVPGTTDAGTIKLPAEPAFAILIRPMEVKLNAGETANLKVVLSKALSSPATINLDKREGVDLTITPTSLTIDAGQTEASFTVTGNQAGKAYIAARLAATVDNITPEQTRAGYAAVYVQLTAPSLSSISPNSGAPGATFTLTGSGFDSEARRNGVFFKQGDFVIQVNPDKIKLTNATTLEGTVPGLRAGAAEVFVVTYQDGVLSARSNALAFTVTAPSAPVLTNITPNEGTPKTTFTITGTGFNSEARRNAIFFKQGDRLAPVNPESIKLTSNTTLQGVVPPLPAGAAEVFVVSSQENAPTAPSNALAFTVKALPAPTLSSVEPNHGAPGESFKLTGTGFNTEARFNYVLFKQGTRIEYLPGSAMKVTATTIEGTLPRLPAGAAEVYVLVGGEGVPPAESNHLAFTFNAVPPPGAPVLTAITPNEGTPGTSFTITGTGFGSNNAVFFKQGDRIVPVSTQLSTANNTMSLTGAAPELPAGAAEVFVVTMREGVASEQSNHLTFTMKAKPAPTAPVLTGITPNEGLPGDSFTIAGTGFGSINYVIFKQGDRTVPVSPQLSTAANAMGLTGKVPELAAGAAEVYVITASNGAASAQSNHLAFTVKTRPAPPAPVLSNITPNEGVPGTTFTITGTGFSSYNVIFFKQGDRVFAISGNAVTAADVANGNGAMSLTSKVPDLPAGAAEVYVVTAREGVPSAQSNHLSFTIKPKPAPSAAVLTSITPNEGAPGASFTISGTELGSGNGTGIGIYFKQGDRVVSVTPSIATTPNGAVTLAGKVPDLPAGAAEVFVIRTRDGVASPESNHLQFTVKAKTPQQ